MCKQDIKVKNSFLAGKTANNTVDYCKINTNDAMNYLRMF